MKAKCSECQSYACYTKGVNCTGVSKDVIKEAYNEDEKKIMQAAAYVEGTFYSNVCRLQDHLNVQTAQRLSSCFH